MRTLALYYAFSVSLMAADLRVGIIGTDTSHATAFTKILNDATAPDHVGGARVVAAYQGGSPDLEESRSRVEKYAAELRDKWQVKMVATIPELCGQVDALMLNSIDGRVHLAQAREALTCRKPMFIDKPLASTLEDAREIARLAKEAGVPWFSSSSLRFGGVASLRTADLEGALTWGPGPLEEHHKLDLTWYAIHPIEMLYTLMGQGCEEVTRISTADADVMVGRWKGGRIGTVRALRPYGDYGAVVYRKSARSQKSEVSTKVDGGYAPLVREIVEFFEGGKPPVANEETLEMFAFMDAAQRSKEDGGKPEPLR
jgi:Oxidoreductase family, NAD-binding Rossmann fold